MFNKLSSALSKSLAGVQSSLPTTSAQRIKDFVNHSFCFEVWIKYAHTFPWACYLVKEAGVFCTLMCCKIGSYTSTKKKLEKNKENEDFITFKVLVQLLVSAEKGRFIPNESNLTV